MRRLFNLRIVSDLSEAASLRVEKVRWVRGFSAQVLRELHEIPARAIPARPPIASVPPAHLPVVPEDVVWEDLRLPHRAHSRLTKLFQRPADLSNVAFADLLDIEGFGLKSLDGLIETILACAQRAVLAPEAQRRGEGAWRDAMRLAQALQRSPISAGVPSWDARFGAYIRSLAPQAGHAGEMAERVIAELDARDAVQTRQRLEALVQALRKARKIFLEDELSQMLARVKKPRDREITARLLGWDGRGGCTLSAAGSEFGITRERTRQICADVLKAIQGRHFVPALDQVLAAIAKHPDQPVSEIEAHLWTAGLTRSVFGLHGILKAAEVFERAAGFHTQVIAGRLFVTSAPKAFTAAKVLRVAQRAIHHSGALTISDLCARLALDQSFDFSEGMVRQIVGTREDFRWLDEATGWFWFTATPLNAALTRIRKVLAVASRIRASELHTAIMRDPRMKEFSAPSAILLQMCRQLPWCRTADSYIEAAPTLDPAGVLPHAERAVWQILKRHGGVLPLAKLQSLFFAAGFSQACFWHYALTSPILYRCAPQVYSLIGAQPGP